jgi:aspartyl-tRNA(Asn)/glutamyl-tRNA(Gln) amidotransferase subunit A
VKDLLDLAGTPTTAGSKILASKTATSDSFGVERLEALGAIIIGKTRMSEFAYSPGSNNGHYGPTSNPHQRAYDAGGSSSGSGAAVTAGIVYAALGSDTGGSIRIPAAQCGIVGLKPTYGRISLHGAVTLSWSLDHLGPLTRSVADAAVMLDALSGYDPRDARTRVVAAPESQHALGHGVRGLRVGVVRDDGTGGVPASEAALAAWRAGLDALGQQGAELIEIDMPELDMFRSVQAAVLALEAASFHEPWLRERLSDYGEFMRQRILSSYAFSSRAFVQAQQIRAILRQRCEQLFTIVDLISTPTLSDVAPALGVPGSTYFTNPFNNLGWPAITVPCGRGPHGLPLGIQIAGRPWEEATVLRAAQAIEQVLGQLEILE